MKIAVTGATGSLGRSLTEFLLMKDISVVALGRNQHVGEILAAQGAHFERGEISDTEYLKHALRSCDLVVHSAGLASPWGRWEDFYSANVVGTEALLEAMRYLSIGNLIHISTPSVYFSGEPRGNIVESEPLPVQKSNYARSKHIADELVLEEIATQKMNGILFRPRSIFGPYDQVIFPRILKVMRKGFFPLPDGGKSMIDLTAVENIVHAIWLGIQSIESFHGEIFNITNGEPITVEELTAKVATLLGLKVKFMSVPMPLLLLFASASEFYAEHISHREPKLSRYGIQSLGITQTLSIEKAKKQLGYAPIISVDEAIRKLLTTSIA